MALFDKDFIWRERFRDKDVSDLDWLEPQENTFDKIEQSIYGKKKKKSYFLFLIPVFIIVGFFGWYLQPEAAKLVKEVPIHNPSIHDINTKQSEKIIGASFPDSSISNTQKTISISSVQPEITPRKNFKTLKTVKVDNEAILGDKPDLSRTEGTVYSTLVPLESLEVSTVNQLKILENRNDVNYTTINSLAFIKSINATLLLNQEMPLLSLELEEVKGKHFSNSLYFSVGGGFYNFKLNQNFASAVEPAEFWHSSGKGYELGLGYIPQLSKLLSLDIGLAFGAFELTSGHNSEVVYNSSSEVNQSNIVNLSMATPLGFIEGETVIQRSSTSTSDQNLNLGLTNHHSLTYVNLHALGLLKVIKTKTWNASVIGGAKVNKFVKLDNELQTVTLDNEEFSIASSQSTSTSTLTDGINSMIITGMQANVPMKQLAKPVFLRYTFSKSMNPVFQMDNLNTTFSYHNLSLGMRF